MMLIQVIAELKNSKQNLRDLCALTGPRLVAVSDLVVPLAALASDQEWPIRDIEVAYRVMGVWSVIIATVLLGCDAMHLNSISQH